jgi:alkanesulfonate monooxygenase SsuD/methylene tetrahydromethanopterin reductase-like flavin-dependent oxidoreductase (luciferase family)
VDPKARVVHFDVRLLHSHHLCSTALAPEPYGRWLEQIDAAQDLASHLLQMTEHHFRHLCGMMPVAEHSRRMRLGSAVSILPMYNPIRIAEDFAMVDLLA